jgi:hypothetical protein
MNPEQGNNETKPPNKKAPLPSVSELETVPSDAADNDFHPIRIKGEPLSETIIRERRERPW